MQAVNIRNSKYLRRAKIAAALILLLTLLPARQLYAQTLNEPFYDYSRWIHFGFTIGTNYSRFKYDFSPEWYTQDTFMQVSSKGYPGLSLGAVANLHLGSSKSNMREHFDLRLIPTLVLSQKRILYTFKDSSSDYKEVESAIIEFPLLLKFKSDRIYNLRFYTVAGGKFSYDLASDYKAERNPSDPKVIILPSNFSYELGAGLDMYFPYFKFSPEIKISRGINNILAPDTAPYTGVFSRFRSNFVYFSLYFEG